jgi:molybdopterin converting factor subunit 1
MIDIQYFASVRERLGRDSEQLAISELGSDCSVGGVLALLAQRHGELGQRVLLEGRVLAAVNQVVADAQARVSDGDEVAFFPPVTGG